jgi:hypothetical protein
MAKSKKFYGKSDRASALAVRPVVSEDMFQSSQRKIGQSLRRAVRPGR